MSPGGICPSEGQVGMWQPGRVENGTE